VRGRVMCQNAAPLTARPGTSTRPLLRYCGRVRIT